LSCCPDRREKAAAPTVSPPLSEAARSPAGKAVTLFRAAGMEIGGCLGCGHCHEEAGACVQNDDMEQILTALRRADAIVLTAPIYFFSVSAQLKSAIDRTFFTH